MKLLKLAELKQVYPELKIICAVGPSGVGKTSVAEGVADDIQAIAAYFADNPVFKLYENADLIRSLTEGAYPSDIADPQTLQKFHLHIMCKYKKRFFSFLKHGRKLGQEMISQDLAERLQTPYNCAESKNRTWNPDFAHVPKRSTRKVAVIEGYDLDDEFFDQSDMICRFSTSKRELAWFDIAKRQNIQQEDMEQFMRVMAMASDLSDEILSGTLRGRDVFQYANNRDRRLDYLIKKVVKDYTREVY